MAFAATSTADNRAFSIGILKVRRYHYTVASGDTTGTITCDNLKTIHQVFMTGPAAQWTAAASISGNVATIAFVDPAATRYGEIMVLGT